MTTTPSSRPRNGRRESTSSTAASGAGRVRKNSAANNTSGLGPARPRANTISHVDGATLGMIAAANVSNMRNGHMVPTHSHHPSLNGFPGAGGFEFRGMSTSVGHHGNPMGLPKLDTQGLANPGIGGGLRTAPPHGGFHSDLDIEGLYFPGPGSTINPAQLHFSDSPHSMTLGAPASPYQQAFPIMSANPALIEDEDNFDWMTGFDNQLSFATTAEQAVDESSPSAISTTSQSGISEVMLDGSNHPAQTPGTVWPQAHLIPATTMATSAYSLDGSIPALAEMMTPPATVSPKSLGGQPGGPDPYFSTPPPLNTSIPSSMYHAAGSANANPGTPSTSSASVSGSGRQSSVTSVSTDSITDSTRHALLKGLSQASQLNHGHLQKSSASPQMPGSPGFGPTNTANGAGFPSTKDLQRFVGAYLQYFHPHLPFLHPPTLSFDPPGLSRQPSHGHQAQAGFPPSLSEGGGCLILSMAAIGALYEFEPGASKELFEAAKQMIQLYLDERRKADVTAAHHASHNAEPSTQDTPLWLVQAMLLNVVYGINCGDKTSGDIARTHCAALVSLARAADLTRHAPSASAGMSNPTFNHRAGSEDIHMGEDGLSSADTWNMDLGSTATDVRADWLRWKVAEERKRTLYAVFIVCSLLVAAYNHAPALTNSEIRLDLPCEDDIWSASSAQAWMHLGGAAADSSQAMPFPSALGSLLSASQRPIQQPGASQSLQDPFVLPLAHDSESELRPSAFGCLVLINALHNYIWETRQRHHARSWTAQEIEAMHAHIEPALKAWQVAWGNNPHHRMERPNPFGKSPLSADSIPLLDLAFVRLFVNLGRSKEAFWQRDFDSMAHELSQDPDFNPDQDQPDGLEGLVADHMASSRFGTGLNGTLGSSDDLNALKTPTNELAAQGLDLAFPQAPRQPSRRERLLRMAAFYAADSLFQSDQVGITSADYMSRELPLQSAMCRFDCAQVLAEWVATVQERVGAELGILGRDQMDFAQVPAIMLLEDKDIELLGKIADMLSNAEMKMTYEIPGMGPVAPMTMNGLSSANDVGYGSKVLRITAQMLEQTAVWPGQSKVSCV
ncbi:MAG: hypothetical protein M1817_005773 [Caeruleum heppii]|nr:MAG: hypothetical protein M1817_005773 [Caeruleum heppii]